MPIPHKPIRFRKSWKFVALVPWRISSNTRLLPGDKVPDNVSTHLLVYRYKTNHIGPIGQPWTNYVLKQAGVNVTPKRKAKKVKDADTDPKPGS